VAWRLVVAAGALDGDAEVAEVVVGDGLAEPGEGLVKGRAVVVHGGGRHEEGAVEVGEHPLGAGLGGIDGGDAEVRGADLLDAGMEGAARLVDGVGAAVAGAPTGAGAGHGDYLRKRG